jgi:hypothetical protein
VSDRPASRTSVGRGATPLVLLAGVPFALLWVGLTAYTGKTYHVAPLLVAAAPGILARRAAAPPRGAFWAGLATFAAGWVVILVAGIEPSATMFAHQPGGVAAETAAFGALGAAVGAGRGPMWLVRRLARR